MENKSIRPGYVPVTIELPAALAEEFQRKSYDWSTVDCCSMNLLQVILRKRC